MARAIEAQQLVKWFGEDDARTVAVKGVGNLLLAFSWCCWAMGSPAISAYGVRSGSTRLRFLGGERLTLARLNRCAF